MTYELACKYALAGASAMTRGEEQVLIASIHSIVALLSASSASIPLAVYVELSAMENFLKQGWESQPRVNKDYRL